MRDNRVVKLRVVYSESVIVDDIGYMLWRFAENAEMR